MTHIALITGGNRGLGRAAALALGARGVDVVLTYRSQEAEAAAVAAQLQALGRKALALRLDVADSASFPAFAERLGAELPSRFGRPTFDFLLNNAGIGAHASFAETTEAQFDQLVAVHLKGVFFFTQKLLPLLADGGRILNVSSGLARFSYPGYSAYASMKGAVEVLTRYLAVELGSRRISVNTLAPGAIATDFSGGAVRDTPQLNAMIASRTALGRVGEADDIGLLVASLFSDDTRWVNGQRIEASGGIHL
ncbi:MAG TPA: SDR family oxidoreductase [Polyangiaceae bacterium]|nr:SDR family oxidoreductase [Polyangiaceae bacterium]